MKRIVIFASGSGTNAERIILYFKENPEISVAALFTDKAISGAVQVAAKHNVLVYTFTPEQLANGTVLNELQKVRPHIIVLAGFLKLLPARLIKHYRNKIINIHPALLPKFGGKGFYGRHVHEAVLNSGDKKTGITIHLVDEDYDKGEILLQKYCEVSASDTPETLAERVRQLEHQNYPVVIENLLKKGAE